MSLQIKKESGTGYHPVFLDILNEIPGGVTVKTNRFPTTTKEIKKGALLNADASSAGLYNIIKTVKITANVTTTVTVMAIEPAGHLFLAGEFIWTHGTSASTISRVSATAIAVMSTGSVIATNAILYETATITTATPLYDADAILRNTIKVRDDEGTLLDNIFAGAVVRAEVDESMLPYFVTDADKTALTVRIRFS